MISGGDLMTMILCALIYLKLLFPILDFIATHCLTWKSQYGILWDINVILKLLANWAYHALMNFVTDHALDC